MRKLLLIAAAGLFLFGQTLPYSFQLFDEEMHILANPHLNPPNWAGLASLWTAPYRNLFIPVTYTAWWVLQKAGLHALLFHAANVLLHIANGALVFFLALELLGAAAETPALVAALIFVCHPLQLEPVAWVSGLSTLLSTGFGLASLLAGITAAKKGSLALRFAAVMLFAIGLLAKPQLVALPAIAVLLETTLLGKTWRKTLLVYTPHFALALLLTALTLRLQQPQSTDWVAPLWLRPFEALRNLAFYAGKMLLPLSLSSSYPGQLREFAAQWPFWVYSAAGGTGLGLLVYYRRRQPMLFATVAGAALALLPVVGLVPFYFQYYSENADRYAYLSLFPISLLGGWLVKAQGWPRARLVVAPVLLLYATLTVLRVPVWKSEHSLATDMLKQNRRSYAGWTLMAASLERDNPNAALAFLKRAHELDPQWFDGFSIYENTLAKTGRVDELLAQYQKMIQAGTLEGTPYFGLGNLLVMLGRVDEGTAQLKVAGGMGLKYRRSRYLPGEILLASGHLEPQRALTALARATQILPDINSLALLKANAQHLNAR